MNDKVLYCKACESKFLKGISDVEKENDKLRIALDKACEELARINNTFERRVITTSSYWKEWLLSEVQEDE